MKIAYAGFDLLYPALKELIVNGNDIIKIYSCQTDNECEFNIKITEIAKDNAIPITYDRITLDDLDYLYNNGCEMLISAGYYYRIPVHKNLKMVNIHPAYLPIGRGAWPMPVTILKGLPSSGVTIHKIEESFDTGDILLRRSFDVSQNEDLISFMEKVYEILPDMLRELCQNFDSLYKNALPQGDGEYWECPIEADYPIANSTSFEQADLILRAFKGYKCIYKDGEDSFEIQYAKAVKGDPCGKKFPIKDGYIDVGNVKL